MQPRIATRRLGHEENSSPQRFDQSCEFCLELSASPAARFATIYGANRTRVVASQNKIVVMPTIGQLFTGSLFVLPNFHFETIADLPPTIPPVFLDYLPP